MMACEKYYTTSTVHHEAAAQRSTMKLLENTDGVHRPPGAPHQRPFDELVSIYADVRSLLMTSRI